jgi:hypothetical protein
LALLIVTVALAAALVVQQRRESVLRARLEAAAKEAQLERTSLLRLNQFYQRRIDELAAELGSLMALRKSD